MSDILRGSNLMALQAGWPNRFINVWHCEGLFMVLLQLKGRMELFVKRRVSISAQYDQSC